MQYQPMPLCKKERKGTSIRSFVWVGNIAAIDDNIEALKNKGIVLKIVEGLQDYLSCEIKFSNDKKQAWLGQPHLIKNMEKRFSWMVWDVWSHKTPGTQSF